MTTWLLLLAVGAAPDAGVFDGCQLGRPMDKPLEEMFVDCPKPVVYLDGGRLPDDATAAVTASSSVAPGSPQAALDAAYETFRRSRPKDMTPATAPLALPASKGLAARRFSATQSKSDYQQWEYVVARPLSGGKVRVSRCAGANQPAGAWADARCRELLAAINTNGVPHCLRPPGPYVLDAKVTLEVPPECCVTSVFGTHGYLECPDSSVVWWEQKDAAAASTDLRARSAAALGDAGTPPQPCTFLGGNGECINTTSEWTGRGVARWSIIRREDVVFVCTSMKSVSEGASPLCSPPRPR